MSSERAGTHAATTLDDAVIVALRESARVHTAERIQHMAAPLLALADKLKERAGAPTHGALNREAARAVLTASDMPFDLFPDEIGPLLDALEACVVPDPRLRALEALLDEMDQYQAGSPGYPIIRVEQVRAILRGDE